MYGLWIMYTQMLYAFMTPNYFSNTTGYNIMYDRKSFKKEPAICYWTGNA